MKLRIKLTGEQWSETGKEVTATFDRCWVDGKLFNLVDGWEIEQVVETKTIETLSMRPPTVVTRDRNLVEAIGANPRRINIEF